MDSFFYRWLFFFYISRVLDDFVLCQSFKAFSVLFSSFYNAECATIRAKGFRCYIKPLICWCNLDFVEWKYLLFFLMAVSLCCVCMSLTSSSFFTLGFEIGLIVFAFLLLVFCFDRFWFQSRGFCFYENLGIKHTCEKNCCKLLLWYSTITSSGHFLILIRCIQRNSLYMLFYFYIYNSIYLTYDK